MNNLTESEIRELFFEFTDEQINGIRYLSQTAFKEAIPKALIIHGVNYCKPTYKTKNQLPEDVKYLFNKGVDLYQTIMNYEQAIIGPEEFIAKIREIEKANLLQRICI
jgi:hypothetical protein